MVAVSEKHGGKAEAASGLRMTEKEFEAAFDEDVRAEWVEGEVIFMSPAFFLSNSGPT